MPSTLKQLRVPVTDEQDALIRAAAEELNISVAEYIRQLIEKDLDNFPKLAYQWRGKRTVK
jgi:hypothetical protein